MTDEHTFPNDEARGEEWHLRPWVLAGAVGLAGLLIHFASDGWGQTPWRMALTAAILFGSLAAAFTLSPQRWKSSLIFAGGVATIMAGIAWRATSAGDRYTDEEFWVAAGVLAVTLALPLFQAGFHHLRWNTSYKATHFHVWTDAISGAGALAFVGLSWLLIGLMAELFSVIQIDLLRDLLDEEWFGWTFAGAAFGAALGVLRNQLRIIGTLQNVVLLVLSILAVPLAIALVIFLAAVLVSGLDVLWGATKSATPLLLSIAVGCFVLTNAVVRDDDADASNSRILRIAGFVLALGILPLAAMAMISIGTRIGQHGLSPERLWALVAIAVAVIYGAAYFISALRGRRDGWRGYLRQSNMYLAVLTSTIALVLALPIFNFGAVSASNQLARLQSGAVSVEDFDYAALRWDYGEAGRDALTELVASDDEEIAKLAADAQKQESRPYRAWEASSERMNRLDNLRFEFDDELLQEHVTSYARTRPYLCKEHCVALRVGMLNEHIVRVALVENSNVRYANIDASLPNDGDGNLQEGAAIQAAVDAAATAAVEALEAADLPDQTSESTIEIREWQGRRIYVDGQPVGDPFE